MGLSGGSRGRGVNMKQRYGRILAVYSENSNASPQKNTRRY